jgi:hypothetical protein
MTTLLKFLLGFVGSFLILWGAGDWLYDAWTRWQERRTRAAIQRWREQWWWECNSIADIEHRGQWV